MQSDFPYSCSCFPASFQSHNLQLCTVNSSNKLKAESLRTSLDIKMQAQLARFVLTSRARNDVAACMPSLYVWPRMLSFLPSSLPDALRPTNILPDLLEDLRAVQSVSCQHTPQYTPLTDRHHYAPALVPVSAACMPLMPAQLQGAVRAAQVQQLASMSPSIPGLEGELPPAVKGCMWTASNI